MSTWSEFNDIVENAAHRSAFSAVSDSNGSGALVRESLRALYDRAGIPYAPSDLDEVIRLDATCITFADFSRALRQIVVGVTACSGGEQAERNFNLSFGCRGIFDLAFDHGVGNHEYGHRRWARVPNPAPVSSNPCDESDEEEKGALSRSCASSLPLRVHSVTAEQLRSLLAILSDPPSDGDAREMVKLVNDREGVLHVLMQGLIEVEREHDLDSRSRRSAQEQQATERHKAPGKKVRRQRHVAHRHPLAPAHAPPGASAVHVTVARPPSPPSDDGCVTIQLMGPDGVLIDSPRPTDA
jgi:hypothetical protein